MSETPVRFEAQPNASNHFAWMRTEMALQRTLMAATRTGVSLIGFGFTVAQFFQRLGQNGEEGLRAWNPETPRNMGLVLIAAGVICVATFTLQYFTATHYLKSGDFKAIAGAGDGRSMHSSSILVAVVIILIGIGAFVSVFARF